TSGASLSVSEIAERTRTTRSSVSELVSRLAERGLVCRQRSARDARGVEVALTGSGQSAVAAAPAESRLLGGLDRMPTVERQQLALLLARLVERMQEHDQEEAGPEANGLACAENATSAAESTAQEETENATAAV